MNENARAVLCYLAVPLPKRSSRAPLTVKRPLRPPAAIVAATWLLLASVSFAQAQSHTPDHSERPAAGSQNTPDATLTAFYHWYLQELAGNREPLQDDHAKLETYVSREMLRELDKLMNAPNGLDADPFTGAQDYLEDWGWASNIAVANVRINGKHAAATVTLGTMGGLRNCLALSLVDESDSWKINSVSHADCFLGTR